MRIRLNVQTGNAALPITAFPGFYDNFNRAEGDAIGFTSREKRPYITAGTGTTPLWTITADGGAKLTSGSGGLNVAVLNALTPNGTLKVTAKSLLTQRRGGLTFRYKDIDNSLQLFQAGSGSPLHVAKRVNGAASFSIGTSSYIPSDGDVYEVVLSGSSIVVKVNGSTIITTSDTALMAETKHGLYGSSLAFGMVWDALEFIPA